MTKFFSYSPLRTVVTGASSKTLLPRVYIGPDKTILQFGSAFLIFFMISLSCSHADDAVSMSIKLN